MKKSSGAGSACPIVAAAQRIATVSVATILSTKLTNMRDSRCRDDRIRRQVPSGACGRSLHIAAPFRFDSKQPEEIRARGCRDLLDRNLAQPGNLRGNVRN